MGGSAEEGLMLNRDKAKRAVVRVGKGRGFVIETQDGADRYIVTAAHCVGPSVADLPCASFSYTEERTLPRLVGPIGKRPTVCVECFFIDPIADIAVLGPPDNQDLFEEWEAYLALLDESVPFYVSDAPEQGRGWLLSLKGQWNHCDVQRQPSVHAPLWISGRVAGGMSGSPILAEDGSAIGIVCTDHGPNPRLASHLPGWLLQELGLAGVWHPHASHRRARSQAKRKGA
jgi:hypothetical protein